MRFTNAGQPCAADRPRFVSCPIKVEMFPGDAMDFALNIAAFACSRYGEERPCHHAPRSAAGGLFGPEDGVTKTNIIDALGHCAIGCLNKEIARSAIKPDLDPASDLRGPAINICHIEGASAYHSELI